MSDELAGRSVLVTGAAQGLGRAYALDLCHRGALVLANDVDERGLQALVDDADGGRIVPVVGDVAGWDGASAIVQRAVAEDGRLDVVINNAGVLEQADAVSESESAVRRMVEVNLLGTLFVGVHALRHFVADGRGLLLNTTSLAYLGLPGIGTYAATKGAVVSLSYSWAREVRGTGVRVNVLAPRARTRMSTVRGVGVADGVREAERVAPVVAALLSPEAAHLNGVVVAFDGTSLRVFDRPRAHDLDEHDGPWPDERLRAALTAVRPPGGRR